MAWFETAYAADWSHPDDDTTARGREYIWATSLDHAERVAQRRYLNEVVLGPVTKAAKVPAPASEILTSDQPVTDKISAITRLCMLARVSDIVAESESLGDMGLIHRALRALTHPERRGIKALTRRVKEIERAIPGYLEASSADLRVLNDVENGEIDADRVLRANIGVFKTVIVAGWDHDDDEAFAASTSHQPDILWLIERYREYLMTPDEDEFEDFDDDPDGEPIPCEVINFARKSR